MSVPPLKPLHPNSSLSPVKFAQMGRLATDVLECSLIPGQKHSLKTRPDGTILDGYHRIHVLRESVDVDALPREIVMQTDLKHVDEAPLG